LSIFPIKRDNFSNVRIFLLIAQNYKSFSTINLDNTMEYTILYGKRQKKMKNYSFIIDS